VRDWRPPASRLCSLASNLTSPSHGVRDWRCARPHAWTCIYDGNRLVEMWDGGNDMSLSFTYGTYIDEVLTLRGVSGNFWYHQGSKSYRGRQP
jgi:hypothetical protein